MHAIMLLVKTFILKERIRFMKGFVQVEVTINHITIEYTFNNCRSFIMHAIGENLHTKGNEFASSSSTPLNCSPLNQLVSLFQEKFTILHLASNCFDGAKSGF